MTAIGNEAFIECSGLTSATLPAGVTKIGEAAFDHCISLASDLAVEGIEAGGDILQDVYNLQGVRVMRKAGKPSLSTLSPGVYIIGGKKIIVR